eukprot:TRINITY_DN15112_c0_g1_i1.p1 TRINITY_DN15112_c0_g1~~TRINITY_DN15112_c0_g1_i1.p1  ORF type:complete len:270 (-),score=87.31 TRINITY_DN15112_c0_g1_i1:1155-1964(-)
MATHNYIQVGRQFLMNFYTVVHERPEELYKFYCDKSTVTRAEDEESVGDSVVGVEGINKKIQDLGLKGSRVRVVAVDCQESLNGSVFISVVGLIASDDGHPRKFTQSFFLERNDTENGPSYYVLNDVFRFLSDVSAEEAYDQPSQEEDDYQEEEAPNGLSKDEHDKSFESEASHNEPTHFETEKTEARQVEHEQPAAQTKVEEPIVTETTKPEPVQTTQPVVSKPTETQQTNAKEHQPSPSNNNNNSNRGNQNNRTNTPPARRDNTKKE